MEHASHDRSRSQWAIVLGAVALCALAGCSNDVAPAPAGSWVEILELRESPDALDVEHHDAFQRVEVLADRLVFTFDGASPLRVRHVVAGTTSEGYLRRIESLGATADGRVEAMTTDAAFPEYYERLHFLFHYRPRRLEEGGSAEIAGLATESLVSGCEDVTPCDLSGGQSFGSDTAGCSSSYGASLHAGPFVETDLTADFEFDHGIDVDGRWGWPPVSVDFDPDAYFIVDGTVRTGVRLSGTASAQLSCNADFAALLGGGQAPEITLAVVTVGPIPITLSATPILNGAFEATADVGEFTAEAGAQANAHAEFGLLDGEPYHPAPEFTFDSFATAQTANAGSISAHGSITAGVQLRLQVGYDFSVDPADVALGAEGTVDLTGTLGVDFTAEAGGCSWNVELPWSCEAAFAVGVELEADVEGVGFDYSRDADWPAVTLASGALPSRAGTLPWCGGGTATCESGGVTCVDELLDNGACEGAQGFRACEGGQFQHCTCTASGWASCGACMTP
ncbi:MAG: hypothetical protein M3Y87_16785 [Myxococcota bacterium]|nr:hypothetical protein [Myxococcota bacterium]